MTFRFLDMAIKSQLNSIQNLAKEFPKSSRFLIESDAILIAELISRVNWLSLISKNRLSLSIKKRKSIMHTHNEVTELIGKLPELNGFSLSSGSPLNLLIENRSKTLGELIISDEKSKCINVEVFQSSVGIVIDYNFGYQFKKELPDFFKEAEAKIANLAKTNRWAARGSWNSFVPKTEKEKVELNFDFLDLYDQSNGEGLEHSVSEDLFESIAEDNE